MTKEEAWLMWMKESIGYVEYDWDTIKKSSHWQAFSRGWDAAAINVNGWDDAYKMGMEAGKELEQREWQELTDEEVKAAWSQLWYDLGNGKFAASDDPARHTTIMFAKEIEAKLKEKNT